jgi:hypothetical protein
MQTITEHSFYYLTAQIVVKCSTFVCFERILQISAEICFGEDIWETLITVYRDLSLVRLSITRADERSWYTVTRIRSKQTNVERFTTICAGR